MIRFEDMKARNERWSALDSRNDAVKRLIRAGDKEENIRRRYPMSDTYFAKLKGQAGVY